MNKRGQFSIIAALLVAVVLVAAVMTTYSAIRYSTLQEQPQVLSAVDEINLALKQILGFTVGYYGSILKVTGNTTYARELSTNYLSSGLTNIADMRPEWGPSFNVTSLVLKTNWYTDRSYSTGNVTIGYDLSGLGVYGMTYSAESRLDVIISESNLPGQAVLTVLKDGSEPLVNLGSSNFNFYRYDYESSTWDLINPMDISSFADGSYSIELPSGVASDSFVLQVEDSRGIIVTASSFSRYTATLGWNDIYSAIPDENIVVEFLQNGTMRWLGQNLVLTELAKPIPPVPVKSIHVTQTIEGVDQEVPFQIEDWASDYRNPLGIANNVSLFSNRNMIVFLANSHVSKFTIWWNGSDDAVQASLAYENIYFDDDTNGAGKLDNGILQLTLPFGNANYDILSTVGGATSRTKLMRFNTDEYPTYGSNLAYIIYNGVVRDIIHQEAEWSGGITGPECPNVYSQIVITLPAQVTYYTYQLRLMFINSEQQRTITDLCPIRVSTSFSTIQTEDGMTGGYPNVATGSGTFYNYTAGWTPHHWSQVSYDTSNTRGAGIMFTDSANQQLYRFDSISGGATGALKTNTAVNPRTIELVPVTSAYQAQFTYPLDVTWHGAVTTFDNSTPIYKTSNESGLWILAEYPPTVTVTAES